MGFIGVSLVFIMGDFFVFLITLLVDLKKALLVVVSLVYRAWLME